jgi:hypothetical protein
MELQRQQIAPAPERLVRIDMARCQQFDIARQIERIAMPVQHRHAVDMAQRAGLVVNSDRMKAQFARAAGIDPRTQRGGHHLRPETHPQRRPVGIEPACQPPQLAGDPRMRVLFIDPHRPAHHDHQIGAGEVVAGKIGVAHIDAIDLVSGRLDRITITGNPFMGHVADDQGGFHGDGDRQLFVEL